MDWWLSVGLCGIVFEPFTLKSCVDVSYCIWYSCFTCGKEYSWGNSRACLASGFLFWVSSLSVSLLLTCGLYGHSACHLSCWFSCPLCPRPCNNSVNINVKFYGGIKPFVLLLAKPSTWLARLLPPHSLSTVVY
jgi:hypothetical protein